MKNIKFMFTLVELVVCIVITTGCFPNVDTDSKISSTNNSQNSTIDFPTHIENNDIDNLKIVEGKDYATLVTCTPYGINTHRLLVRGCRTETPITAESDITIEDTATKSHFSALLGIILGIVMIIVLWGMKKFSETRRR